MRDYDPKTGTIIYNDDHGDERERLNKLKERDVNALKQLRKDRDKKEKSF